MLNCNKDWVRRQQGGGAQEPRWEGVAGWGWGLHSEKDPKPQGHRCLPQIQEDWDPQLPAL